MEQGTDINRPPTSSSATERGVGDGSEAEKIVQERDFAGSEREGYVSGNANGKSRDQEVDEEKEEEAKKPSFLARIWKKIDLDLGSALMMMKAGLPPTIALAMYQSADVANEYSTLGYLVAIMSILGFCIMPRAKFIQTMTMNVLSICIGAAVDMLMLWSSLKAREHTTPADLPPARYRYNSSQSAVLAVWLFFQIWLVNTAKAKFPQLTFPTLVYAIFVNIAATTGPQFQTMVQVESFVKKLLMSFLTGFGIATGVSLFILPVSCRTVVTKEITGYVGALRGALKAHKSYFQSMETKNMFRNTTWTPGPGEHELKKPKLKPEIEAVKKSMAAISALHGKLHGDLAFAKREMAYGKLSPDDFESIFKNLRAIMMPTMGLGSLVDLFERVSTIYHWEEEEKNAGANAEGKVAELRETMIHEWNEIMRFVHEPFAHILDTMDQGLEHVALRLALIKPPKDKKGANATDPEAKGEMVKPGDKEFAQHLKQQTDAFYKSKDVTLRHWLEEKGIEVPVDFFDNPEKYPEQCEKNISMAQHRNQRQLYVVLYIVFLLHAVSRAILDFVEFADERDQAVMKKRLITPGKRRFKKWIASTFSSANDSVHDDETTNTTVVYMGEAFNHRKDPEHLPPTNAFERFGNKIRAFSGFLGSPESAFGFRAACATMSIGIIAFLGSTQLWFIKQRVVWAMIMVALSMTPTSGQSIYSSILRIIGTAIATIVAWLIWYIPGTHTAGIIVFLWVFVSLGFYVPIKRPELVIMGLISIVTATMIVGYELQVRKVGEAVATSNGQPYLPITTLGPYRLAIVSAGLGVALFWTFFPYPITEHSALRTGLGGALYLSANFYSIMHETVMARIRGDEGDTSDKNSPGWKLEKARNKVFAKQMLALQGLQMHSAMVKFDIPMGGKFPKKEYDEIIGCVSNIINYTALLGYASATFVQPSAGDETDASTAQWFRDFRRVVIASNVTSHEITSLLSLLSSSITNGQPLPPYLVAPSSFQLSRRLEEVDRDILSVKHISEPGYAAFAVLQISTRCIHMDIEKLLKAVRKLVGELDFSFHIVSTKNGSESASTLDGSDDDDKSRKLD